jgi:O-antigen ligase
LTLEKLRNTEGTGWQIGDCVGWLEPHNSYIHILYRAGIVGLFFIIAIWVMFIKIVFRFIQKINFIGILLTCALLYWLILGNFIVLLELPYFAIPFWSLYGIVVAYSYKKNEIEFRDATEEDE